MSHRAKRTWSCPVDAEELAAPGDIRRGAETLGGLFMYPEQIIERLGLVPERRDRLLETFSGGVLLRTHYSGMLTPEVGLNQLAQALRRTPEMAGVPARRTEGFKCVHSCDIDADCQRLALAWADGPEHVFGDLQSRLPEGLLRWMDKKIATAGAASSVGDGLGPEVNSKKRRLALASVPYARIASRLFKHKAGRALLFVHEHALANNR